MVTIIRAVYENGYLRPLDPLELREGEQVNIHVEEMTEAEKVRAALGNLVRWPDPNAGDDDDIDEEALMREIEEAFRGQPPLSETIIQERMEGP